MDIKKLQRAIVDGLEDVKAQHIAVFNTEHLSSMFERVIIASGTSNRQTKALAASVRNSVKGRGMQVMATEGEDNGEWIIVDCGAAVVHVMQPAIREYYNLEEIWGGKTVRMKVGEVNTRLVKASEPEPAARKRAAAKPVFDDDLAAPAPARKAPAKRGAAKTEADKKMANKSAAFNRVASKAPARPAAKSAPRAPGAPGAPGKAPSRPPTKSSIKTVVTPASKSAQKASAAKKAAAKTPARSGARTATHVVSRKTPARKTSSR